MSKLLLGSLMAVLLGSADPVWGEDAKRDQDKIQGTWQATEGIANGKPVPKEQLEPMKVVFSGEKMSIFTLDGDGKETVENTFRLGPSKKPKVIDAMRVEGVGKGKTTLGIYELDGDTLKLCISVRLEITSSRPSSPPRRNRG